MKVKLPDMPLDSATQERLERLRTGSVLLARESLKDANFDGTVVLICVYSEDGAYGLVMNRPSHMPLSEMFDGYSESGSVRTIYMGGPVRQEELQVLHVTDTPAQNAFKVAERVFLGGKWDDHQGLLKGDEATMHLFLGYSGWAPGQLEYEIIAGTWDVYNVDVEMFLAEPMESWGGGTEKCRAKLERLCR
jgi:putative transcriptional regulator